MVNVTITFHLKHQVWYVVACETDLADGSVPQRLPGSSHRRFLSSEAAMMFLKPMVFRRLLYQGVDATDAEISYHVNILPPAEEPRRS
jgi:hypothetical protein